MQPHSEAQVEVQQLQLECGPGQRAIALAALDSARWPLTRPQEILLIRRLEVTAPAWGIGHASVARLQQILALAASPWDTAAQQAQAVRFAGRAEWLACLCQQIIAPDNTTPWFWQQDPQASRLLHMPKPQALLAALSEHPLQLPLLMQRMQGQGALLPMLRHLGPGEIGQLLAQIEHSAGFVLQPAQLIEPRPREAMPDEPDHRLDIPDHDSTVAQWHQAIAKLPDATRHAAAALGAVVLMWQRHPHRLQQHAAALQVIRPLQAQLLTPPTVSPAAHDQTSVPAAIETPRPISAIPSARNARNQATPEADQRLELNPSASTDPGPKRAPAAKSTAEPSGNQAESRQAASQPQARFYTDSGGFFYLLNLLRFQPMQERLNASPLHPWQHLVGIARIFDIALDAPLQHFLADQLGLDHTQALAALPIDKTQQQLSDLMAARVGHLAFWPKGLVQRSARVIYDPVHLDIELHSNAVEIDIRLAGLDVNPGWLPWLGRIVNFHYLNDPRLLGAEA